MSIIDEVIKDIGINSQNISEDECLLISFVIPKAKAQILFPQIRAKISDPEQENVTLVELDYIEVRDMIQQLAVDRADES